MPSRASEQDLPDIDDITRRAKAIIENVDERESIDKLSGEVVDMIATFVLTQPALVKYAKDEKATADLFACVMGWILGFHSADSMRGLQDRLAMAAFIAPYSTENTKRVRLYDAKATGSVS